MNTTGNTAQINETGTSGNRPTQIHSFDSWPRCQVNSMEKEKSMDHRPNWKVQNQKAARKDQEEYLSDIKIGKNFLHMTQKWSVIWEKFDILSYIKSKTFYSQNMPLITWVVSLFIAYQRTCTPKTEILQPTIKRLLGHR